MSCMYTEEALSRPDSSNYFIQSEHVGIGGRGGGAGDAGGGGEEGAGVQAGIGALEPDDYSLGNIDSINEFQQDEFQQVGVGIGAYFCPSESDPGVIVVKSLLPGSPAEECGKIAEGDVIVSVDGALTIGKVTILKKKNIYSKLKRQKFKGAFV